MYYECVAAYLNKSCVIIRTSWQTIPPAYVCKLRVWLFKHA